ncbi:MAG: DUF4845 domain-containing protein [Gammaproteobacteria bacterium]|nr:DUF4845 domain-containing protein [Gammaproteobacteria bacterium]
MMNLVRNQRGMTGMGWLIIIALIISGALLAMKIGPIYISHGSVLQSLKYTANQPGMAKATLRKARDVMAKQLNISSVYGFDMETVTLDRTREGTKIIVDYEVREPIVGNLSIVASFYEVAEASE